MSESDGSIGSASSESRDAARPTLVVAGRCVSETLDHMASGQFGSPLTRDTLDAVRLQAEGVMTSILEAYARRVAVGEVGEGGSASVDPTAEPIDCPTGLLYGRIQSGKTNAMILTVALAIDNGFRVVVVLTSNSVELVDQTSARFRVLSGPLVHSSNANAGNEYEWDADFVNLSHSLPRHGIVIVCAKEASHQSALIDLLQRLDAASFPALIFDDEADQATPDTTAAARASQRSSAPSQGSKTYRLTIHNDASTESGFSLREVLKHNVFLQVTATPYALLLQNIDSPLRPKFTRLLRPGDGYTGGEAFFANVEEPARPPLMFVDEAESDALQNDPDEAPAGLSRAIVFFILAATAHQAVTRMGHRDGYKFLCHTSAKTADHTKLGNLIRGHIESIAEHIEHGLGPHKPVFEWAWSELSRSVDVLPPLPELVERAARHLHQRRVQIVNSSNDGMSFGPHLNFMVGGNILGRGLTIENLLVTYYLRKAKTTQMDTMLQHARMYGYRGHLMPFSRVFLPFSLAIRFRRIHESETALRELLAGPAPELVPVRVAGQLRPTRPGIIDPGALGAYRPGQQVYPVEPEYRRGQLGTATKRIEQAILALFGGGTIDEITHSYHKISIEDLLGLIEMVRTIDSQSGDWDVDSLTLVLRSITADYRGTGYLYLRTFSSERGPRLPTGVIGDKEQPTARAQNGPVLFMLLESGMESCWDGAPFWFPTVVFPSSMVTQVFNVTDE